MAVYIPGKTRCPLCGQPALGEEFLVNFPSIFANQLDPASAVNDAVVHRRCLAERPYGQRALAKLESYQQHQGRPKVCQVCGLAIADPDDYFALGPISDYPDEPLARFDWFQAHLHCLRDWDGTPGLVRAIEAVSRSAEWEGDVLERLLEQIRRAWSRAA